MTETDAERYVAGRMSDSEGAAFEALMIEREDLAADVALRQRIKAGLAALDERGELQPLLKRASGASGIRRYAIAASAVLVLVAAGTFLAQQESGRVTQGALLVARDAVRDARILSIHTLAQPRSNAPPPRIAIPAGEGLLQMQLFVDAATPTEVSVTLATGPADQQQVLGDVHASRRDDGVVEVWLRSAQLNAGVYTLTVTPLAGDGGVQSFAFEIGSD